MNRLIEVVVTRLHRKKAEYLYGLVGRYLKKGMRIMDLGCGSGVFTKKLIDMGYEITPVDVVRKLKIDGVEEIIYDGKKLPFKDKEFGQVMMVTVLHHVPHFRELLREVARVSREIIIVEDTYENGWDKFWTQVWDSILNLEFWGHPHNNLMDWEWRKIFAEEGIGVLDSKKGTIKELVYGFKQVAYLLKVLI